MPAPGESPESDADHDAETARESKPDPGDTPGEGPDTDERSGEHTGPDHDEAGPSNHSGSNPGNPDLNERRDGSRGIDGQPPIDSRGATESPGITGRVRWFLTTSQGWPVIVREVVSSALIVALVGLLLFGISGVWPPMVAVESGSMEPHMHRGDLVFIMDEQRLVPDAAHETTGVVTYQAGSEADYRKFGTYGDVIVFDPPEKSGPPIIHRAHFWVDAGENWYDRANPDYVDGDSCREIASCPAPHAGFVTRGDANPTYDQVNGISGPVRPAWITGTAEVRIPLLGHVRLRFSEFELPGELRLLGSIGPTVPTPVAT